MGEYVVKSALLVLVMAAGCTSKTEQWQQDLRQALREKPDPVKGLLLRVRPDREVYRSDEPIMMELTLENVSAKDIAVYIELETGVLVGLRVRGTGKGNRFNYVSPAIDLVRTPENFAEVSHYVVLPPGYYVGRPIILSANLLRPGKYSLTAVYQNKFASCLAKPGFTPEEIQLLQEGALMDGLWRGRVVSNAVDFEVVKARGRRKQASGQKPRG